MRNPPNQVRLPPARVRRLLPRRGRPGPASCRPLPGGGFVTVALDPVTASEVLADLSRLTRRK